MPAGSLRARIVLLLVLVPALLLLLPGEIGTGRSAGEPIVLTYREAKAAGLAVPPLPAETGIRVCTDADRHEGFKSSAAAAKALAEYEARWGEEGPRYCQEDPEPLDYYIFPPGTGTRGIFETG